MIIDGTNAVFGRMATQVAKKALLGENIDIVNCEKIIMSGKKEVVFAKYKRFKDMGVPRKGPFYPTTPDKFVKRIIRAMVPYKQPKGREALERIKCYKGVPSQFEGKELQKIGQSNLKISYVTIAEICKSIGGKI